MKRLLLFLALPLAASQESPKQPDKTEQIFSQIKDLKKEVPEAQKMYKALSYLDFTMRTNVKKLETLKDTIVQSKNYDSNQIKNAKKWMAEIEMMSLYISGCFKSADNNVEGIKEWKSFFDDLDRDLWGSTEKKSERKRCQCD